MHSWQNYFVTSKYGVLFYLYSFDLSHKKVIFHHLKKNFTL